MEKVTFNQAVFQNLLENIPGMLYRCKFQPSWPILYVSQGSFDLTGYYPEELLNAKVDFASLIHPADRDWVWAHFTIQLSKNENCNCEYRLITKEGKQKWVREIASGVFDKFGGLLYIEGYIIDVTEKKEHQQIIASLETHVDIINTNERRMRALLNAIPDTLIRIKADGSCFMYSSETGMAEVHNPGSEGSLSDFLPSHIAEEFIKYTARAIKSGRRLTFEYELEDEGGVRYFESRIVKSGDNEVISIIRDVSETVKAEQEIIKTQKFYHEIINNSNAEIAVYDKQNRYMFISRSGINNDEVRNWIIGKTDLEYCHERGKSPDLANKRTSMLALVREVKRSVDWLEELKDDSGNSRFFIRYLNPFSFDNEEYIIGYGLEITALKVIQNELQRREELLTFSHEVAKIGYWVYYNDSQKIEWSSSIYKILEADTESIEPSLSNYISFVHPDDRSFFAQTIEDSIRGMKTFSIEYRIITSSGKIKFIKEHTELESGNESSGKYVVGLLQDITDFKTSQAALIKREDHFRAISESSPVLILEVDSSFKIRYINTLKFKKPAEVLGRTVFYFTHNDYIDLFKQKLEDCFKTGEIQQLQILGLGVSPEYEWYQINIGPVKDKDGNIDSLVLLSQNITKAKNNEKERDRLIKEINHKYNELMQFNYIVSHNLRAPLANILGISHLLQSGLTEEESKDAVADLINSAESVDVLIRDLNNILASRSALNEKREKFYLKEVIQSILDELEIQINASSVKVSVNLLNGDEVIGIKSYVQSILHHLISNAIKYKHPEKSSSICINVNRNETSTLIEIADNGIGINLDQYRDEVFGLYKRFTNTVEGKGLGLYMVKSQIESIGGSIDIESKVNVGTTFKITLNNI